MQPDRTRRRSVGFLDREGEEWSCYLVTAQDENGRWRGYFSFRPKTEEAEEDEIRTADIFIEASEAEIDRKARGLGRPLLNGLLNSAIHTRERTQRESPQLRRWFREMLQTNARELAGEWANDGQAPDDRTLGELRSIYSSYRMDQVAHFIALLRPEDFQVAVDRILEGQTFDFGAKDRLQFAMMVVEHIESLLPLPPFEVWAQDYVTNADEYQAYTHALYRDGLLP